MENVLKEIEYLLKRHGEILDNTKSDSKEHLLSLGYYLALADLKYSINFNKWLYKESEVK